MMIEQSIDLDQNELLNHTQDRNECFSYQSNILILDT